MPATSGSSTSSLMKYHVIWSDTRSGATFDAGLDVFYKVTPQLTAALTVNTDFAETEVDERQVNLTRFPLFFPEKRDFFLDGTSYYTFGSQFAGAKVKTRLARAEATIELWLSIAPLGRPVVPEV